MRRENSSLLEHVFAALSAAVVLVLCQVAVETAIIAAHASSYLLSPSLFFGGQMYDFCVKLLLLIPGFGDWFRGGGLDAFLPIGFASKLGIGAALLGPNLLAAMVLGALVGVVRWLSGRRAGVLPALLGLVVIGFGVHVFSWLAAVHVPKNWNVKVLLRQSGRVLIWQGAWLSFVALAVAAPVALLIGRMGPAARWAVSLVLAVALGGTLLALPGKAGSTVAVASPLAPESRLADNLILISIDSLRADRVGAYGNPHDTSPTIDRLARAGVRFTDASSSSSWTLPSHMSMLTGRDVLGHGVISLTDKLSPSIPTLAGTLGRAGLATAGIVSTPVLSSRFGFDQGFDSYDDHTIPAPNTFDAVADEPAPMVEKLATEWLRQHASQRFFLFLHFWDVHYDYIPPAPYDTMFDPDYKGAITGKNFFGDKAVNKHLPPRDVEHLLALYDGEIRWVDDHIGRILAVVDELGLAGKTAIVITADHGDEFFEHGFKGHGRTLYNEVTRIPLVMVVPGVPSGQVLDKRVGLADLMPTALSILGVESPPGMNGVDLLRTDEDSRLAQRAAVVGWLCSLTHRSDCMTMQNSAAGTLIQSFQPLKLEFYSPGDLAQRKNIARESGWPREEQMGLLDHLLNSSWDAYRELGAEKGGADLDAATRDRLHDLGYTN